MKGRVEHRDLGHIRAASHGYLDAQEVRWIVQRCQRRELPDGRDHPIIDEARLAEGLPPVNDAMSDREQLRAIFNRFPDREQLRDSIEGCGVIPQLAIDGVSPKRSFLISLAVNEPAARLADALGDTSREERPFRHVEELVLQ